MGAHTGAPLQILSTGNIRPRLDDVDLPFHVSPFDVLISSVKDSLDTLGGSSQSTNHVISQHHAFTADRNFPDAAMLIEYQQAIFFRSRQDLDRIGYRAINNLLGDSLPFHDLHAQAALGANVNRALVDGIDFAVERVSRNHDAGAFRVDSFLNQHRHVYLRVIDPGTLARFISFKVPHRSPDGLDCFEQLIVAADVRHRGVQPGAIEVRQVLAVCRAAREHAFAGKLSVQTPQHFGPQLGVNLSLLKSFTHLGETYATIRGIVNELLIVQHLIDRIVELVRFQELVVVEERNGEPWRDAETRQMRVC